MVIRVETKIFDDESNEIISDTTSYFKDEEIEQLIDEAKAFEMFCNDESDEDDEITTEKEKRIIDKYFGGLE